MGTGSSRSSNPASPQEAPDLERWLVLLAGGIGSRFWPASTPKRPKQFLPLATARPLIMDTLERALALTPAANVLIVAGRRLRPHLETHLAAHLGSAQMLFEPEAKGTAPALAWAAHEILKRAARPEHTVMVSLHCDHVIRPLDTFVTTLERAIEGAAQLDRLLTVGVRPSRPETGYGYIEVGDSLTSGVLEVRRFVEKPDQQTAQRYLDQGDFLWNSGMFVWRPQLLLAGLRAHTPEIAGHLDALDHDDVTGFFNGVTNLTIDYGLMERSRNIAVVEAGFEWDDVGAWAALMRVRQRDQHGNILLGEAHALDCRDTLVWAEEGPVVTFGLSDLVVVRASGITFVASLERAADLKRLLAELPDRLGEGVD